MKCEFPGCEDRGTHTFRQRTDLRNETATRRFIDSFFKLCYYHYNLQNENV
jgi:hypothetical protein